MSEIIVAAMIIAGSILLAAYAVCAALSDAAKRVKAGIDNLERTADFHRQGDTRKAPWLDY